MKNSLQPNKKAAPLGGGPASGNAHEISHSDYDRAIDCVKHHALRLIDAREVLLGIFRNLLGSIDRGDWQTARNQFDALEVCIRRFRGLIP